MAVSVVYCEGWDPASRAPFGLMPEASARERDRAGEQYAVLLRTEASPVALLQVAWARRSLGIFGFDEQARRIREFDFRVLDDPGRLRWCGFRHWLLESPRDHESAGKSWRFEVTIDQAGWAAEDFHADDQGRYSTRWELPENLREIAVAGFGNWHAYPGTGEEEDTVAEPVRPAAPAAAAGPRWRPPTPLRPVNVEALFTAGAILRTSPDGYGEGRVAVVREPYQAGVLRMPTGRLIAGDPFILSLPEPFTGTVPPGAYPVSVAWAGWADEPGETVTAVRVLVSEDPVATWEMAVVPGQEPRLLPDGGYLGFGVDSGIGAFADGAGREALPRILQETYGADDPFPDAAAPENLAMWIDDLASGTNMVVYPAGIGDGEYPVWIGRAADGRVVSVIADMALLNDAALESAAPTPAARYVLAGGGPGTDAALPLASAGDIDDLAGKIVARADQIRSWMNQPAMADSGLAESLSSRAVEHEQRGEYEEALRLHDVAVRLAPHSGWSISLRGETRRLMERYEDALADFDRAIELDPGYAWAIGSRAQTLVALDRFPEALTDLDRAIELDQTMAWAYTCRGEVHGALGHPDAAAADFSRAAELDAAEPDA